MVGEENTAELDSLEVKIKLSKVAAIEAADALITCLKQARDGVVKLGEGEMGSRSYLAIWLISEYVATKLPFEINEALKKQINRLIHINKLSKRSALCVKQILLNYMG